MWYFYILQSQKDKNYFYKGSTNNLPKRVRQHNKGEASSTKSRQPWKLVYYEAYLTEKTARKRERSVKRSGSVSTPLLKRIKKSIKEEKNILKPTEEEQP